eukprot:TRINITY_DN23275_c0_g1_i1.p1 TRINITY_DN23275_c0_g1~~TRINITY_DN23275_c0_g1_i1.p1  ORF type:complete len:456 (-),score=52.25 TRINITY_DN23275_c0_g1_i1:296-1663(-)
MVAVYGHVDPGYEKVRETFLAHFHDGVEHCAQICAYVRGRKVVDLWGEDKDAGFTPQNYGPDSLQNVFSSSKAITSLVVAMLVDQGHLRYDQRISEIWPEYAQHKKEETTIAMLMRHEAGLSEFDTPLEANDLTADRVLAGSVSDVIAKQKPAHAPGSKRVYHALTRGWIINEVVRRVDPKRRTVGQFLREEIATPLGLTEELAIGLPEDLHGKVAPLHSRGKRWAICQYLRPRCFGGGRVAGATSVRARVGLTLLTAFFGCAELLGRGRNKAFTVNGSATPLGKGPKRVFRLFNTPEARRCEIPSANGHASARALALIATVLAEGGTLPAGCVGCSTEGQTLLTKSGFQEAMDGLVDKNMFGVSMPFNNAGWCKFQDRLGFMGWMGLGGSVLQWHREDRIGFGYAMNLLEPVPWNARALALQQVVQECARSAPAPPHGGFSRETSTQATSTSSL